MNLHCKDNISLRNQDTLLAGFSLFWWRPLTEAVTYIKLEKNVIAIKIVCKLFCTFKLMFLAKKYSYQEGYFLLMLSQ